MMAKKIKRTLTEEENISLTINNLSLVKENLKQEVKQKTIYSYFRNYDSKNWLNLLDKNLDDDEIDKVYYDDPFSPSVDHY